MYSSKSNALGFSRSAEPVVIAWLPAPTVSQINVASGSLASRRSTSQATARTTARSSSQRVSSFRSPRSGTSHMRWKPSDPENFTRASIPCSARMSAACIGGALCHLRWQDAGVDVDHEPCASILGPDVGMKTDRVLPRPVEQRVAIGDADPGVIAAFLLCGVDRRFPWSAGIAARWRPGDPARKAACGRRRWCSSRGI